MRNGQYSALKPAWHLDKLRMLREGAQPTPAQIQLVISDLCNHDCSFCAYRMTGYPSNQRFGEMTPHGLTNNPNRMIPYEKACQILDDAALLDIKAIQFTGGGEPTVHPNHIEIFQHALKHGMQCALVTNGALLRRGWEEILPRFKWIRFSLDAGTAKTYSKIRGISERVFDKVLGHIKQVVQATDPEDCTLGASFIITRDNWKEMGAAAMAANYAGLPSIRFAAIFTPTNGAYYGELGANVYAELAQVKQYWRDSPFQVIDMFTSRLDDLKLGSPDYKVCGYQHFNVYVGADLNVYRCCNTAYNDMGYVGSLKGQSFMSFWNSHDKFEAYRNFDPKGCERCAFNDKNRIINYLLEEPLHVEFV